MADDQSGMEYKIRAFFFITISSQAIIISYHLAFIRASIHADSESVHVIVELHGVPPPKPGETLDLQASIFIPFQSIIYIVNYLILYAPIH